MLHPVRSLRGVGLALVLSAGSAAAQTGDDAVMRSNQLAYEASMKCFVADGHAAGLRERAGDVAKAQYYQSKAHEAFDAAAKLGTLLQLSGSKVSEDFGMAQSRELPPMVMDQAYFLKAAATCKALGLM